jgi:hypothetical protein
MQTGRGCDDRSTTGRSCAPPNNRGAKESLPPTGPPHPIALHCTAEISEPRHARDSEAAAASNARPLATQTAPHRAPARQPARPPHCTWWCSRPCSAAPACARMDPDWLCVMALSSASQPMDTTWL